ncbi:MAG: hypothetical protein K9N10_13725 [Deltaproteobacteria bacterium]|nr:hypothetical protein [Deltaproteobacteria bacterium]
MRTVLYFLILTVVNGAFFTASAEELFLGRVLSVDSERGKLSVVLIESESDTDTHGEKSIDVSIPKDRLPKRLLPGNIIRIWGGLNRETGSLNATSLQASGQSNYGKDATGVRRRIGKSRSHFGGQGGGKGRGRN